MCFEFVRLIVEITTIDTNCCDGKALLKCSFFGSAYFTNCGGSLIDFELDACINGSSFADINFSQCKPHTLQTLAQTFLIQFGRSYFLKLIRQINVRTTRSSSHSLGHRSNNTIRFNEKQTSTETSKRYVISVIVSSLVNIKNRQFFMTINDRSVFNVKWCLSVIDNIRFYIRFYISGFLNVISRFVPVVFIQIITVSRRRIVPLIFHRFSSN